MAANVLNSPKVVQASVLVVRAFVHLRQMLATNRELAQKLAELEQRIDTHDQAIAEIMTAEFASQSLLIRADSLRIRIWKRQTTIG